MTLKHLIGLILAIVSIIIASLILIKVADLKTFFSAVGITIIIYGVVHLILYLLE